ncbi:hypothetical protein CR513_05626, partial [Mucuna pruriens]
MQPVALSALTQYYDPPLRCFTFQGFQLAPTLEEYERLIGIPCDKSPPYLFRRHYPSWASVARLLKVLESKVLKLKKYWNGEEEDWLAFVDVYGLLVYGIMLFPPIECYVDLAAIDAFLGKRDRGEHPVVVVLANTYYTLDYCSKKNAKGVRCCTSLLFLWLIAQLFHSSKRTRCPIEDHYWSCIKPLTKAEWTVRLDEALERYPMVLPPSEEAVTPFVIHGLGIRQGEHLKKIRQAWKKVVKKGPEWGLRSCGASSSYKSWLESIFLTFGNPRFEAVENELAGLQRQSKRKRKELDFWEGEESRGAPEIEWWFQTATQEKGLRELERNQASLEKEVLIAALANAR